MAGEEKNTSAKALALALALTWPAHPVAEELALAYASARTCCTLPLHPNTSMVASAKALAAAVTVTRSQVRMLSTIELTAAEL
jgi:hypothetical protein